MIGSIVNGRYDMFCPPQTAWELHKGLPESRLYIIADAGHSTEVWPRIPIYQLIVYVNLEIGPWDLSQTC